MRILRYPDLSKRKSRVIIFDGFRIHTIPVVFCNNLEVRSCVDLLKGCIEIDERHSTEDKRLLLHHEVEHLNKKLLHPFWFPSLKGDYAELRAEISKSENLEKIKDEINKMLEKALCLNPPLNPDSQDIIPLGAISVFLLSPYRPDNFFEDLVIETHLIEKHGFKKEDVERIGYQKDLFDKMNCLTEKLLKYEDINNFAELLEEIRPDYWKASNYQRGFFVNTLLDLIYCGTKKIDLQEYYSTAFEDILKIKKEWFSRSRGIFREILKLKLNWEIKRLSEMEKIFSI